jgi:hypothetical protein
VAEGITTTLVAALDPALDGSSGAYLNDSAVCSEFAWAKDEKNAAALWRISEELVEQKFD